MTLPQIHEHAANRFVNFKNFGSSGNFSISGSGWAYKPGPGESVIATAPKGQGNFGTPAFFKEAMPANVQTLEAKGMKAYHEGLRGFEIEALEQAEKMKGIGQSNH